MSPFIARTMIFQTMFQAMPHNAMFQVMHHNALLSDAYGPSIVSHSLEHPPKIVR